MIIVCDRCSEDKSAGLGTYYHIIIQILDLLLHGIDCQVQSVRILQYTCDITEMIPFSGKSGMLFTYSSNFFMILHTFLLFNEL